MAADPNTDQDRETLKRLKRRVVAMGVKRQVYDQHNLQVARYTQPRLGRYLQSMTTGRPNTAQAQQSKGAQVNSKLLDTTGIAASGVLGNGMSSGLANPTEPWFKLGLDDDDLKEYKPVKEWLDLVTRIMFGWFSKTNYYEASKAGFLEQGIFGTEAAFIVEHWRYGYVVHPMTFGQYWLASDDGRRITTMARQPDMSVEAMVAFFGLENCPRKVRDDYGKGEYDKVRPVFHFVEPNTTRVPGKLDARNKAYIGRYWSGEADDNDPPFLKVEGYNEKPFYAARWDIIADDDYGTSPGHNALPALRGAQMEKLRTQQGYDYGIRPSLYGTGMQNTVGVRLTPGALTLGSGLNSGEGKVAPMWEVRPEMINQLRQSNSETQAEIKQHFYTDLFMAITNMPGVQPRNVEEIARRHEEQLSQLGPVIDRSNNEKLRASIERTYHILDRAGLIPPPPQELSHTQFQVEFISVLVQAQRLIRLGGMERVASFTGNLIAVQPTVADKLDFDQMVDEYADAAGSPASIIRSDDEVAKIRAARANQQQAAQAVQMAPAAKDGAMAARLLSEADVGNGKSALQRLLGQ